MKRIIYLLLVIYMPGVTRAQHTEKWEFGISAEWGRDYYNKKYDKEYSTIPGLIHNFTSNYSWGTGIWAERKFTPHLSALTRLEYAQKDLHPDLFYSPSRTADKYFTKERHHRGTAEIGARWHINPKSLLTFFVDARVGVNALIVANLFEEKDGKYAHWDAFGYDRFAPAGSVAVGIKWKRLALMAEYDRDLARVKRKFPNTGILAQSIVAKSTFTIFKSR